MNPREQHEPALHSEDSRPVRFVTLSAYWTNVEAWIVRNLLVANGVPAFVINEFYITTVWIDANACGGVAICVPQEHAQLAQTILDDPPSLDSETSGFEEFEVASAQQMMCSSCGSTNVAAYHFARRWMFLLWMFVGFPVPVWSYAVKCFDCGKREGPPSAFGRPQFQLWHLFALMTLCAIALATLRALGDDAIWRLYAWLQGGSS